ncbi:Na+/H+ antiporter NhaA, partial [Janibacter hoylei]|uniref:Na+/H+ antiporter NhaA n=1 Tax=Janibacter hoylei TaxID=364298 RepID=UPI002493363C
MSSEKQARTGTDSALRNFLKSEAAGGILLMFAAALAMIVANSPLYDMYHHFLHELKGPVLSKKLGP